MTNKEAIEIIRSDLEMTAMSGKHREAYNMAIKALQTFEVAEWIEVEPTEDDKSEGLEVRIVCSRCKEPNRYFDFNENHEIIAVTYVRTRFCPNCGARMLKDFNGGEIR